LLTLELAVAFAGSRRGGLALRAIAQARLQPIPFFAEMSSVNPVFVGKADLVLRRLNIIMKKTRQNLEVPLNDGAAQTLEARQGAKHGPYVFYNPTKGIAGTFDGAGAMHSNDKAKRRALGKPPTNDKVSRAEGLE
jgi:hypothetical protein